MDEQYLAELEKALKGHRQPQERGTLSADIEAGVSRGREYRAIAVNLATRHAMRWLGTLFRVGH